MSVEPRVSLEGCDNGEAGEEDHGEKTVAQHADHTRHSHTLTAHQIENEVHADTAKETDTVDVTKLHLTTLYIYKDVCPHVCASMHMCV